MRVAFWLSLIAVVVSGIVGFGGDSVTAKGLCFVFAVVSVLLLFSDKSEVEVH